MLKTILIKPYQKYEYNLGLRQVLFIENSKRLILAIKKIFSYVEASEEKRKRYQEAIKYIPP